MNKQALPSSFPFISSLALTSVLVLSAGCSSNSDSPSGTGHSSLSSSAASSSSVASEPVSSSSSSSSAASIAPAKGLGLLELVDLDTDGSSDVVWVPFDGNTVYWNRHGAGDAPVYTKARLFEVSGIINKLSAIDVDGDSDMDIVISLADGSILLYTNTGNALNPSFDSSEIVGRGTGMHVKVQDLTGDSRVDILLHSSEQNTISLLENDSVGEAEFASSELMDTLSGEYSIVSAKSSVNFFASSLMNGTILGFEREQTVSAIPSFKQYTATDNAESAYAMNVANVDDNGFLDLLWASYSNGTINWSERDGALTNPAYTTTELTDQAPGIYWLDVADVNDDSNRDILAASADDSAILWLEGDGATPPSFTLRTLLDVPADTYAIEILDYDKDGDMDIVLVSKSSDDIVWYINDGDRTAPTFTKVE